MSRWRFLEESDIFHAFNNKLNFLAGESQAWEDRPAMVLESHTPSCIKIALLVPLSECHVFFASAYFSSTCISFGSFSTGCSSHGSPF